MTAIEAQRELWEYIKKNGCQIFDEEYFIIMPEAYRIIESKLNRGLIPDGVVKPEHLQQL